MAAKGCGCISGYVLRYQKMCSLFGSQKKIFMFWFMVFELCTSNRKQGYIEVHVVWFSTPFFVRPDSILPNFSTFTRYDTFSLAQPFSESLSLFLSLNRLFFSLNGSEIISTWNIFFFVFNDGIVEHWFFSASIRCCIRFREFNRWTSLRCILNDREEVSRR